MLTTDTYQSLPLCNSATVPRTILPDTIFRGKATTENTNTAESAQIRPGCLALSLTKRYTNLKDTRDV